MRLAPLDIYNKEFSRAFSGYHRGEVDCSWRKWPATTKPSLARMELRQQVEEMGKRLADYARLEESIRKAMVLAQSTADEARANARRESELIIQEARQEAVRIQEQAHALVRQEEERGAKLREQRERFVLEFTALLRSHLAALENGTREDGESP